MTVLRIDHTKLSNSVVALRTAWDSNNNVRGNYNTATDDINETDKKFLFRILRKHKHETGYEFLQYIFKINGISIGCQNQLVRHRTCTFVVRSTRYCKPTDFVRSGNKEVDKLVIKQIKQVLSTKGSNDVLKYALPQATSTNVVMRIDGRNLRNFLELRLDSHAHPEIRELANKIYEEIPEEHKYLYEDIHEIGVKEDWENNQIVETSVTPNGAVTEQYGAQDTGNAYSITRLTEGE